MQGHEPALKWIEDQKSDLIETLINWSNINSGSFHVAGVRRQAQAIQDLFKNLDAELQIFEVEPLRTLSDQAQILNFPLGPLLRYTKRPDAKKQILLTGHLDTVFPDDSAFQNARLEGDKLFGPGVVDMKGGILVMYAALMALEQSPFADQIGWEIIFNPDEEIGSLGSAHYLKEAVQGKDFGLIFEPAMDEHGCVVDKRKGSGKIAVGVTGVAAHAGRDFHKGVNAITALSEFLLTMDKLNGQREGFTLNVGKVVGGIAENVVPEHAVARLDIRYEEVGARDWLMGHLNEAVADWKKRHKATIQIEPVFTREPKNIDKKYRELLDQVILTGQALNQTIHTKASGGVCDGNILASAGLVNVDTLGVLGGGLHSEQEFMLTDSLVTRAQLTALLIMRYASGEWSLVMHDHFVIRPVKQEDFADILDLARQANPGLTNLLPDPKLIQEKIDWSILSFYKKQNKPCHELYFFVLEDLKSKKIIGTCGIFSDVGDEFYSFKVSREIMSSEQLNIRREHHSLELVNDYKNVSEIGLLLINKRFRKMKLGKFLSRSRYLYIADNLEQFHPHIIAEMRGKIDFWGKSVFWDAVGSKFIDLSFTEADYLTATNHKHFISELLPRGPIPIALLSESAQQAIGAPHPDTSAAVSVLLGEGFEYSKYIDIFDGGPTLEAVINHIKTVSQSKSARISSTNATSGKQCMVSHQGEHYRIGMGEIVCHDDDTVSISARLAESLQCSVGDKVRYHFM